MKKYYLMDQGQQLGPFTSQEIKNKGFSDDCYVYHKSLGEWKKISSISQFYDDSIQSYEPNSSGSEKLKSATQTYTNSNSSSDYEESFFSPNGRLRRKDYIIRTLLLCIPMVILELVIESPLDEGAIIFSSLAIIALSILFTIQAVKRIHDLNQTGWLWLLFFIPLINFILGIYILFARGTKGSNKYGPDPKA